MEKQDYKPKEKKRIRKIWKAKENFEPLFFKGDKFVIIKRNKDPDMTPIEAMRLKDKQIYGFDEGELE